MLRPEAARPLWQSDAKWLTSLITILLASASLLLATLYTLTARTPVVEGVTLTYGIMISGEKGLDSSDDIDAFKKQLAGQADAAITPIPGLNVSISLQEVEGLSPRQARLAFVRKFVEPMYDGGADGVAALASDPAIKAKILESQTTLDLLSVKTHEQLRTWLAISLAITGLFLLLAMAFAFGWGRLATAGWIIVAASGPGALFWWLLTMGLARPSTDVTRASNAATLASYVAHEVLPASARTAMTFHRTALLAGLALIVLAVLGGLLTRRPAARALPPPKAA